MKPLGALAQRPTLLLRHLHLRPHPTHPPSSSSSSCPDPLPSHQGPGSLLSSSSSSQPILPSHERRSRSSPSCSCSSSSSTSASAASHARIQVHHHHHHPPAASPSPSTSTLSFFPSLTYRKLKPDKPEEPGPISEHEYRLRVGKAVQLITNTLPDFMEVSLVDLKDLDSGYHGLLTRRGKARELDQEQADKAFTSIYHPSIAFCFHPPVPHLGIGGGGGQDETEPSAHQRSRGTCSPPRSDSVDFPLTPPPSSQPSPTPSSSLSPCAWEEASRDSNQIGGHHGPKISFRGRTLYMASAQILRHALGALFSNTNVSIEKARFEGRTNSQRCYWPGITSDTGFIRKPVSSAEGGNATRDHLSSSDEDDDSLSSYAASPDALCLRVRFEGTSRVTTSPHSYTVLFRYEFDRRTGKVARHVVDNVQPVPGRKIWAGLENAWGNLSPAGAAAHNLGEARSVQSHPHPRSRDAVTHG
ncbi:hypothetical protein IE53DRAFT_388325 [Violaceomyces palustris]|uniref:Uncharacterized protein n=1 Tax=Violaceomyces palustris TaxID=1673888 RepID=A0ACD0NUH8_9BASI|nr:hypothetical protein IE53DRAFT_388325 [Violaceomyces palustris]